MPISDSTFMSLMKVLPKSALSTAVGVATRLPAPAPVHQLAMKAFAKRYGVSLDEAEQDALGLPDVRAFFTRKLKPGLRPIAPGEKVVVSPVDGAVSQAGYTRCRASACRPRGSRYPIEKLLGDAAAARPFDGGAFATLYLSPRDYHRIHTPLAGEGRPATRTCPGEFWPVNRASVTRSDALFCVNERLVTLPRHRRSAGARW